MSVLELKAIVHEKIVGIQTKKCLERVLKAIDDIQGEEEDWWDELTDEQRERLEKSIAESRDPANRISHKKVKKKMAKWLKSKKDK